MSAGFANIIGHRDVVEHLTSALEMNKVSHAYILNGEKGCGKKTLARTFAQALQCESEGEKPCGECPSCKKADHNNHPDIMEVLHEKPNTVSVNDVREKIVADVAIRPYSSKYKVYIVPDCEKMNQEAQNALLKTLEEPPEYVVILLLTTNADTFLPTILSRCVTLNMKPVSTNLVCDYLMKTVQIPDYQAEICVSFAQGNIGKAVRLASSEQFGEIMAAAIHLVTHVREMDIAEITASVKAVTEFKMDIGDYLDLIALWYRDVLYFKATHDANGILFKEHVRMLREQTNKSSYEGLENILTGIANAKKRLSANVNFELTMELLFLLIKENSEMTKIVGIRFRTAGKVYYFDPKGMEIRRGEHVIVETARGVEYGLVVVGTKEVPKEDVVQPLKPVIRVATPEDDERAARNREKEKEALKICHEKILKHELEMKLIDAEYTFDNNKILFYFTADGRIDFRELVKDLAVVFKMRIELRQIGVRDETKILGGVGICGRPLCCHTYLSEFAPVSIKMAKEQSLSLNPTKISGVCGRLMCCLKNEEDTYEYLNSRLPGIGDYVTGADGLKGEVHSVNVLRQTVKVLVEVDDEKEIHEYPVDQLRFKPKKRKPKENKSKDSKEEKELAELESRERKEGKSKL